MTDRVEIMQMPRKGPEDKNVTLYFFQIFFCNFFLFLTWLYFKAFSKAGEHKLSELACYYGLDGLRPRGCGLDPRARL